MSFLFEQLLVFIHSSLKTGHLEKMDVSKQERGLHDMQCMSKSTRICTTTTIPTKSIMMVTSSSLFTILSSILLSWPVLSSKALSASFRPFCHDDQGDDGGSDGRKGK